MEDENSCKRMSAYHYLYICRVLNTNTNQPSTTGSKCCSIYGNHR